MRAGDYTASIVVDENELEEYEVTLDPSATAATCWVASEVGKVFIFTSARQVQVLISLKKFSVRWKCHSKRRLMDSSGRVDLDGTYCGGLVMSRGHLGHGDTANLSSISHGTTARDFVFSNLQLTGKSTAQVSTAHLLIRERR